VAIAVSINGRLLGTVHCDRGGERRFEKAVPAEWLRAGAGNLAAVEIDKLWVSPSDGAKLGFILGRAGFVQ
jgi:hypothetical protein